VPDHDTGQQQGRASHSEPRRFVSLVEQLHRQVQQRRAEAHHEEPHEAPLVGVNRRLVIWTAALVFVGLCSLGASLLQWDAMRGQLKELRIERRAWIAPLTGQHQDALSVNQEFRLTVNYQNPGKEPALDLADKFTGGTAPAVRADQGWDALNIPPNHACDDVVPIKGHGIAYPGSNNFRAFSAAADNITQQVIDGKSVIYIQGCFAYNTLGTTHHSAYCFYLHPEVGRQSQTWAFRNCPGENQSYAD
jgi:hypothetical protein